MELKSNDSNKRKNEAQNASNMSKSLTVSGKCPKPKEEMVENLKFAYNQLYESYLQCKHMYSVKYNRLHESYLRLLKENNLENL
jgi:hypothetical protein